MYFCRTKSNNAKAKTTTMNTETIRRRLTDSTMFDWSFNTSATTDNGMKISIQGRSVEDAIFLFEKLKVYLYDNNMPFKVATAKRFELDSEQGFKAFTIYCPDGFDFEQLCEDVYGLTMDYKGWQNIKTPTSYSHYAGGLFVRNDRDANGVYVSAN